MSEEKEVTFIMDQLARGSLLLIAIWITSDIPSQCTFQETNPEDSDAEPQRFSQQIYSKDILDNPADKDLAPKSSTEDDSEYKLSLWDRFLLHIITKNKSLD